MIQKVLLFLCIVSIISPTFTQTTQSPDAVFAASFSCPSMVDEDNDGVPNVLEDRNGNGDLEDDDTDGDGIANYLDDDDDGDGFAIIYEDVNGDGDPTNDDTDGDGTPNYLDDTDDGDDYEFFEEDTNQNGDPTDDDDDQDGIPNYLDSANEVATETDCSNGKDDDGDGLVDCEDLDCLLKELKGFDSETEGKTENRSNSVCFNLDNILAEVKEAILANQEYFEGISLSAEQAIMFGKIESRLGLAAAEKTCLLSNAARLQSVSDFLAKHESSNSTECSEKDIADAVAKSFISLDCEGDGDVIEIMNDLSLNAAISDPLWDILKEQLAAALTEIVADLIPGGTAITIGPELLDNIRTGNWMDAIYNALDIALNEADNFNPVCKGLSLGLAVGVKYKTITKTFKVLKEAKRGGTEFVIKMYSRLRKMFPRIQDMWNNVRWISNKDGTKIDNFDAQAFFEEIKEEFGGVISLSVFDDGRGNDVFKLDIGPKKDGVRISNQCVYIVLYPDSNSGHNWNIEFRLGDCNAVRYGQLRIVITKFRFDR